MTVRIENGRSMECGTLSFRQVADGSFAPCGAELFIGGMDVSSMRREETSLPPIPRIKPTSIPYRHWIEGFMR